MHAIRIIEIPDCKMVSSGVGMFGEETFDRFHEWFSALPPTMYPKNFLFYEEEGGKFKGMHWLYMYDEGMDVPAEFDIIDFKGGLYSVATDIDGRTDVAAMNASRDEFLAANGFELDGDRRELGNIITPPNAEKVMGYNQMDYYTPIQVLKPKRG